MMPATTSQIPTETDLRTQQRTRQEGEAWARWLPAWHGLFYGVLAATTLIALINPDRTFARADLALPVAALILWHLLTVFASWGGRERPWAKSIFWLAPYWAVGSALWFNLTGYDMLYFILLSGLIPQLFIFVPLRWAVVGVTLLAGSILYRLGEVQLENLIWWLLLLGLVTVSGTILAHFISDIIRQSEERKHLLEELERTRRELAQAERQAGVLQERQRLAREIHDTLAQGFTSIVMNLEAAEGSKDESVQQHYLAQAKQMARTSLAEARNFIWELRPIALEKHAFERGLREVIDQWATIHQTPAALIIIGTCTNLAERTEHAILRIVQEALANIRKHARASRVTVTLTYLPQSVLLDIQDEGVGFDPQMVHSGFGLPGMRERAAGVGGMLTIESVPGEGTTIVLEMPIEPAPNPQDSAVSQPSSGVAGTGSR